MSSHVERVELNIGQNPHNREILDPSSVEVRFGDPMVDAPRLLQLFTDPETIEHIAGITPDTTEGDIRDLYRNSDLILLTAEIPSSGLIVGTITAQKPAFGATAGGVLRLAVDVACRGNRNLRVGNKLIKTVNALIFRDASDVEYKGLNCTQARASVILGVEGELKAQNAFTREGYVRGAELVGTTLGWSNRLRRIVNRSSQPMTLTRSLYRQNRRGEHIRYFPTIRPAN